MKFILSTLASLMTVSAWACPQFNGTYACKGDGIDQTFQVKTETVNGVTQYTLDKSVIVADGKYHKVDFMGGQYDIAGSCAQETLSINMLLDGGQGDSPECGAEKWNLLYTLNWTPNGNNISETHSSSTVCESGKTYPSDQKGSMTCIKQ